MGTAPQAPALWRRVVTFSPAVPAFAGAVRQTLAFVVPLSVGVLMDRRAWGLSVGLAAMASGLTALEGPYRTRLASVVVTTAAIASVWVVGSALASPLWLGAVAAFVLLFVCGFVVVLGMPAMVVGGISAMFTTVAIGFVPPLSTSEALWGALGFAIGGAWTILLVSVSWAFERDRPDREAVAGAYRTLGGLAQVLVPDDADPMSCSRARAEYATALSAARQVVRRTRRDAPGVSKAWFRLAYLVVALPSIEDRLLRVEFNAGACGWDPGVRRRAAESIRSSLGAVAATVVDRRRRSLDALGGVRAEIAGLDGAAALEDLAGALERAEAAASPGSAPPPPDASDHPLPPALLDRGRAWRALSSNLRWSSVPFRYALRLTVVATAALLVVRAIDLDHGYWVPMTVVIVLTPDYGGTLVRSLQRLAGTALGVGLTILFLTWVSEVWVSVGLVGLLMFATILLISANYGIAVTFITGIVLISMSVVDSTGIEAVEMRGALTGLGSVVAIVAGAYLWPLWGRQTLPLATERLLQAVADLVEGVCTALALGEDWDYRAAREAADLADSNMHAEIQRSLADSRSHRVDLAPPTRVSLAARSLIDVSAAVEAARRSRPRAGVRSDVSTLAGALGATLRASAEAIAEHGTLPPLPDLDALLSDARSAEPDLGVVLGAFVQEAEDCVDSVRGWNGSPGDLARAG